MGKFVEKTGRVEKRETGFVLVTSKGRAYILRNPHLDPSEIQSFETHIASKLGLLVYIRGVLHKGSVLEPRLWRYDPHKRSTGRKTIVHVNQHKIRSNAKTGAREPVLTIKQGRTNRYAHEVTIDGPSKVVYSPDKPLACGARVWVETEAHVTIVPTSGSGS